MKALTIFLASLCIFSGCGKIKPPNTDVMGVNVPSLKLRGYNLSTDYDQKTRRRKPGVVPKEIVFKTSQEMLAGVNKMICTDAAGYAELERYIEQMNALQQSIDQKTKLLKGTP